MQVLVVFSVILLQDINVTCASKIVHICMCSLWESQGGKDEMAMNYFVLSVNCFLKWHFIKSTSYNLLFKILKFNCADCNLYILSPSCG